MWSTHSVLNGKKKKKSCVQLERERKKKTIKKSIETQTEKLDMTSSHELYDKLVATRNFKLFPEIWRRERKRRKNAI